MRPKFKRESNFTINHLLAFLFALSLIVSISSFVSKELIQTPYDMCLENAFTDTECEACEQYK